jgi:hypothetical protein
LGVALAILAFPAIGTTIECRAAAGENHLYDRWQLSGSTALVLMNTKLRIDARDGTVGTELDLEDDLGFSPTKVEPRIALRWRPGRRHEIEAGYLFARRSSEATLDRTITVGDTIFDANADVQGLYDSDYASLTYRFAFNAEEGRQLGVGLGLGAYLLDFGVDALATATAEGEERSVDYSSEKSFIGPTGTLGLYGRFRVGESWYIEADARALYASIDRFEATVLDANGAARWYVSSKIALEAGYALSFIDVDVGPPTDGDGIINLDTSAKLQFSQQNFRLGLVWSP